MSSEDLALHKAHPYPCKFPPSIVQAHLPDKGLVFDPYCGSGTTLLEAAYRGLDVFGVDCNPIATLISDCKLVNVPSKSLYQISKLAADFDLHLNELARFDAPLHEFPGRDHWFSEQAQKEFAYALKILSTYRRGSGEWSIIAVALSAITNRFSNQDSETRYAAVSKPSVPGTMTRSFLKKIESIISALHERGELKSKRVTHLGDLRHGVPLEPQSVDVIITSPPYANTMDYYLYHKQRMNILGFDFKQAQNLEIGSRHQFSSKKDDVSKWNEDYELALSKALELLKPGGVAWIIIGDSQIAGDRIDGGALTVDAAKSLGYRSNVMESIPMAGKSRLFAASFQRPNKYEHVVRIQG
ncbi:Methyltransferase domain [Actinobacteria bacterium IMCC26256]|nr:Methyltransferase domain [Actinobacteria bacterium IMCC26256]